MLFELGVDSVAISRTENEEPRGRKAACHTPGFSCCSILLTRITEISDRRHRITRKNNVAFRSMSCAQA